MTSRVRTLGNIIVTRLNDATGPATGEEWIRGDWEACFYWGPEKSNAKAFNDLEVFVIPGDRLFNENRMDRCDGSFDQEMHLTVVEKVGKPVTSGERGDDAVIDSLVEFTEQLGDWLADDTDAFEAEANVTVIEIENVAVPFDSDFMTRHGLFVSEWRVKYAE